MVNSILQKKTKTISNPNRIFRKIIREEDIDEERNRQYEDSDKEVSEDEEEEAWEKPSSYNKLVNLLKKNSRNADFYKRQKLEEEGLEDALSEEEEDEDDQDLDLQDGETLELTAEQAEEFRKKYGDAVLQELQNGGLPNDDTEEESEGEDEAEEALSEGEDDEENEQLQVEDMDDEELAQANDFYEKHFGEYSPEDFNHRVALAEEKQWKLNCRNDPVLNQVMSYSLEEAADTEKNDTNEDPSIGLAEFKIKQRLHEPWSKSAQEHFHNAKHSYNNDFTDLQYLLYQQMQEYKDIVYANRSLEDCEEIRRLYCLHAVNHSYKTRDRILKNNIKITAAQNEDKDIGEIKDQGFTRPKVLIVVPFRNSALKIIDTIIELSGTTQQDNKKRLTKEFGVPPEDIEVDTSKPADFNDIFTGNPDDCFRVGIKFTRKTMKIYSDFYSSDIIVASPLGLRLIIGTQEDKKRDFDFLSSIEMLILDQTDVFLTQNWEHVEHLIDHLNLIPKDSHGCDFSRVKGWYLDGRSKYLRQTLSFSSFLTPEINAMFNKNCKNIHGKLKIKKSYEGSIHDVLPQVQQVFTRIPCKNAVEAADVRFRHFIDKVLPTLRKSAISQEHTLIFIPSYFDFVRVRNYFTDHNYSFAQLCEYTSNADISRSRSNFFHGRDSFMLYTERFHFFRRYNIRGIKHVVFYGLPDYPQFYSEILNCLTLPSHDNSPFNDWTCTSVFTRYDMLKLERIVGTKRAQRMISGDKEVFMFA
ncbi:rRNA-binding ribosome biosynthesis protein utp25, variant 2 [Basidiobolus ranarum]|uniref:U3 small nucleolar RNA-associated protein 25 n=1 Tax=Basidiobolus ranarum TaxID=34480 RepID=A0ABR2WMF0_9FUNG